LAGAGTYSGSTQGLASSYALACRTSTGPDAVFRFALTEPHDVQVTVSGGGSGVGVALRQWSRCATGPEEKCTTGNPPTLLRRSLPAGEYAIVVQSSGAGAAFDLSLRITDPTEVPPVDVCSASTTDISGGGTFTGMFLETENDYALSCHTGAYRDAAYRFTIATPQDVTLMASTTAAFTPTTYVSIVSDCASASTTVRCTSQYGGVSVLQRELAAGTYYVLVESSAADASTWSLTASFSDPAPRTSGDACSSALEITAAAPASVAGAGLELDSGTSCGGSSTSYHDASFYFDLAATSDVTLRTTQAATHYATLQTACGVVSSELRCWSGSGTVGQSWRSLPAGRYYVTVALPTWATGDLVASLEVRPPTPIPPNDQCAGAIVLTHGSVRRDTTVGFEDHVRGGTCASTSYPDAFYAFSLTEPRLVVLNVLDADGGTSRLYLTLRASCTDTADIQCVASAFGSTSATLARVLDPGDYVLIVETTSTDPTDYTISASFFAPP
ncbi:MAG: hypothetical protein IT378_13335, partial [Sandaracinaceae bacterium]|nr:hypothetical protein [Sandaracinaceae bacterium]